MATLTASEQVRFEIGGMTCASCAARIEKKLNRLDGVAASVNYATEKAAISFDPRLVQIEQLVSTVEGIGYQAAPVADGSTAADDPATSLRRRLIAAVALGLPLLLVAMVPAFQFPHWEWVALVLATPIVFWGGWPFHRTAALNLRHASATMDTLISLGTLAAWTWSVVVLAGGLRAHTYFEVAGVITTLILLGRFFEARARRRSARRSGSR